MALIDSLKAFYKDSVEDINKLNDADSVLEVLRAKYGDYKGANIAEYIQELIENDITPGGSTPTGTISITENGEGIDVSSYAYADVNVSGGGSGDFSTATVSLEGDVFGAYAPVLYSGGGLELIAPQVTSSPVTVVLYKGKCILYCPNPF